MAEQAILQLVDRCVRCRGCMVACKRNNWITQDSSAEKTTSGDLMVIKQQASVENPPFVRYSCWHCSAPPCAPECPFGAIIKQADGAVTVDHNLCNPYSIKCTRQCLRNCMRGGYPKIGFGSTSSLATSAVTSSYKMFKCNLCYDWSQANTISKRWKQGHLRQAVGSSSLDPTSTTGIYDTTAAASVPACVQSCPSNALKFGNKSDILTVLETSAVKSWGGAGSVYWAITSNASDMASTIFAPPTADPFAEDHAVPMVQGILASPAGKALVLPTLATAGLYALYKRKVQLAESK